MLAQDPYDHAEVFAAFGLPLAPDRVEPLYPFAPVFRVAAEIDVVLKRTRGPLARAEAIARWEDAMLAAGVPVVAPVPGLAANPLAVGDDVWVVYPYIEGGPYEASAAHLAAAGDLLGRLHAQPGPPALPPPPWGGEVDDPEGDLARLEALELRHEPAEAAAIVAAIADWLEGQPARHAWLMALDLPMVDCSCDFKANNLVFTPAGPVLIDPDNAGRHPRVLDLALACLLFHNEVAGGGGAMLSPAEWACFRAGYLAHVTPTPAERAAWPAALRHVFCGHGLWLVFNEYEIDAPVQQAFMDDMLAFVLDPDRYPL